MHCGLFDDIHHFLLAVREYFLVRNSLDQLAVISENRVHLVAQVLVLILQQTQVATDAIHSLLQPALHCLFL